MKLGLTVGAAYLVGEGLPLQAQRALTITASSVWQQAAHEMLFVRSVHLALFSLSSPDALGVHAAMPTNAAKPKTARLEMVISRAYALW